MNSTENTKFVAYNPLTRKYEEVYPESELPMGTTIIKMYRSFNRKGEPVWVTIPGDDEYIVK